MLKNVFLTGGTGCLGRYVVDDIKKNESSFVPAGGDC